MRAAVARAYGGPEVVVIESRPDPVPKPDEVLVRIMATPIGASESAGRLGEPAFARLFFGLRRPRLPVLGSGFAGTIIGLGADVTEFEIGDRVYGSTGAAMGAHAELIAVKESSSIALLPDAVSFVDAVGLTDGGLTALPFLRDTGRLAPGQRLIVNGASGAVGSAAVQLGRHFGATVTAVTSTPNVDVVRALGAHEVIDYTVEDFTLSPQRWDVVFDAVGLSSFARARRVLTPTGIFMSTVPGVIMLQALFSKRAAIAFTGLRSHAAVRPDLVELARLAADGVIDPLIDSQYPLGEIAPAYARVDSKRKVGTVVLEPQV